MNILPWQAYLLGGGLIAALVSALWLLSLRLQDASIVDIFWGAGFVFTGWLYYLLTPQGDAARKALLVALVTVWGLRLSLHIWRRNWGKGEDFRYRRWREEAGAAWIWQSYFKVFLLQGALMWLISAPLLAAQASPAAMNWLDWAALPLWAVGFLFEALGDWQLARFRADPANRGQTLQSGLWRYTRHPNYFGDAVQWWAFYLPAAASGGMGTIFSPLLMTFLLLRVSGVALLERSLADTRPQYRAYMERTSAFFPWPPKSNKG
jgi:steroid 5-alpha reductase family enzyme